MEASMQLKTKQTEIQANWNVFLAESRIGPEELTSGSVLAEA